MANKYLFRVPYSCTTYGTMRGYVIAENEEEAYDRVSDSHTENEEHGDNDSENYDYDYSETNLELEEEDIDDPYADGENSDDEYNDEEDSEEPDAPECIPYYLSDIAYL